MAKVLVLGGSDLQSNFIQTSLDLGHQVHVLDMDSRCWAAALPSITFAPISFADVEVVDKYFVENGCDLVVAACGELANRVACEVSHRHGLPYNSRECVAWTTNKHLMRQRMREVGLPGPCEVLYDSTAQVSDEIGYPCLVKPLYGSAGRGISVVHDARELPSAVQAARLFAGKEDAPVLVEEFITGPQYSLETITFEGKHHLLAITREYISDNPGPLERVDEICLETNALLWDEAQTFISSLLDAMDVRIGAAHIEARYTESGFKLIELGSRDGSWRATLMHYAQAADFSRLILASYLGEQIDVSALTQPQRRALCALIYTPKELEIYQRLRAQGQVDEEFLTDKPFVSSLSSMGDCVGHFFSTKVTYQEMAEMGWTF